MFILSRSTKPEEPLPDAFGSQTVPKFHGVEGVQDSEERGGLGGSEAK
jgi:hypothetical protein